MNRRTHTVGSYVLRGILPLVAVGLVIGVCEAAVTHGKVSSAQLVNALLLVPFWAIALVVHEAAHAAAGKALGLYLWRVKIGSGPIVWRRRVLGFDLHVHALPLSGGTMLCPRDDRPWRWRMWLAVAAGPVATALLLIGGGWMAGVHGGGVDSVVLYAKANPAGVFATANALALAASLFPGRGTETASLAQSDGLRLLTLPFSPALEEQLRGARFMLEAEEARERGELDEAQRRCEEGLRSMPDSKLLRHQLAVVLLQKGDMASARPILIEIRDALHLGGQLRWSYENDIAWASVYLDDPKLVDEAFQYAKANVRVLRAAGWAHRTYGAVLVRRGRLDAAVSELLLAWQMKSEDQARAHNAAWLAAAEAGRGRMGDARSWLETARSLDPDSYSLPVAMRAIVEAERRAGSAAGGETR